MSEPQLHRQEIKLEDHPELDPYFRVIHFFVDELEAEGIDIEDLCCVEAQFQGFDPYILRDKK